MSRWPALVIALLVGCPTPEEMAPPMKTPPETSSGDDGGSSDDGGEPGEASDLCVDAPRVSEGRTYGSLRGNLAALGGACGDGGPDAFVRIDVPVRADVFVEAVGVGFSPRVGVLPAGCANDWAARTLACTEGVGAWILDVPPGASLVASVGIDPTHPQLDLPAPGEGDDPLEFALDVMLRPVLAPGELCEPSSRGRCGTGTACLDPPAELGQPPGPPTCTPVGADTCAQAEELPLPLGTTPLTLPVGEPHTDAHAGSCTGAHRPDRVYALRLPDTEPPSAGGGAARRLEVATEASTVGLSLRAGGCLPDDEADCAAPHDDGVQVAAEVDAAADDRVFLIIELPPPSADGGSDDGDTDGTGEEAPISLKLTVSAVAPR